MFRKISLLVFLSIPLVILADDHGKKEGKSPKEMKKMEMMKKKKDDMICLLYTSPSPRDDVISRMPSSA